jgi:hypothetical protein
MRYVLVFRISNDFLQIDYWSKTIGCIPYTHPTLFRSGRFSEVTWFLNQIFHPILAGLQVRYGATTGHEHLTPEETLNMENRRLTIGHMKALEYFITQSLALAGPKLPATPRDDKLEQLAAAGTPAKALTLG